MFLLEKFRSIRSVNLSLLGASGLLNIIGLTMLYSLTSTNAGDSRFIKQAVFTILGVVFFLFISSIHHQSIKGVAWQIYGIGILSLVCVLLFGTTIRGTRGWFTFAGLSLQPVEFVKIILIILLAQVYSVDQHSSLPWKRILQGALLTGIPTGLVLLQPDFGSSLIVLLLFLGLTLVRKISWRKVFVLLILLIVMSVSSWIVLLQGYQKERVLAFVGITEDPYGIEYNVTQSIIAIGSGGIAGRGLGFGSQSQLRFLPESATDFIFSSTTEELGMIGALVVLGLFFTLFYRAIRIARESRDSFSALVVVGIGIMFFAHFAINIGTTLGLLPVAGVPLPFMSYGGSFLLTCWIALGIVEGISRRNTIVH